MTSWFGVYEILHELKSGGMGEVLLGRRRGPGAFEQLVAIKTIRAKLATADAVRAMFLDEAAILARVNHPGIATVHDFGEEGGTLYMVMEYVAGNSLRTSIDDGERMPPGVAARVIADAARALHAAHEARDATGLQLGVVHRDVSPDNVMLGFDGHIKVIDFGIALIKNRQAPVTEFGTVKGKPPYMSPEQVKNEPIDRRSDVFSLGVVLHELLTGRQLFQGDSMYAIAFAVSSQDIEPPSTAIGAPLPPGLDDAVMRALERDPDKRTATAAQLADELERVVLAAGDESLAVWAERELAAPRHAHRSWLANVVAEIGVESPRLPGRPTGERTKIGPQPIAVRVGAAPSPPLVARDPIVTHEQDEHQGPIVPSRSRLIFPIIGILLLVAGIVTVVALMQRHPPARTEARLPSDAPLVTFDATALAFDVAPAASIDDPDAAAAVEDAAREDAAPIDAARHVAIPRDAARAAPPIDAALTPPRGVGTVSFRARRNTWATVVLDGKALGSTPILYKTVLAGPHVVEFIESTGDVTTKLTFDLAAGETKNVSQATP